MYRAHDNPKLFAHALSESLLFAERKRWKSLFQVNMNIIVSFTVSLQVCSIVY